MAARKYRNLKQEFLICRVIGHAWDETTGLISNRKPIYLYGRRFTFRCIRCTTIRYDVYSTANGELMTRDYEYPDGYHIGKFEGDGTLRMKLRVEMMVRKGKVKVNDNKKSNAS